jgi:hypothetical protein
MEVDVRRSGYETSINHLGNMMSWSHNLYPGSLDPDVRLPKSQLEYSSTGSYYLESLTSSLGVNDLHNKITYSRHS